MFFLTHQQKRAATLVWTEGMTQRQAAVLMKLQPPAVSRLLKRAQSHVARLVATGVDEQAARELVTMPFKVGSR
jgi:predicted transcriptional regulator